MDTRMTTRRPLVTTAALVLGAAAAMATAAVLATPVGLGAQAPGPDLLAITGAKVVPVAGAPIENGTVIVRGGLIEAVGAGLAAPAGAAVIDGKGLTVYPGLIDLGNGAGLDVRLPAEPANARTRLEIERWTRQMLLHPQIEAADHVRADAPELKRLALGGVTTVLVVPPGAVVRGQSSLLNVAAPDDQPQIGNIADERRGLYVVKTPVALHVEFSERGGGSAYPASLMGVIGFVRQAFSDAAHYQAAVGHYEKKKGTRPVYDAALEAMAPALAGKIPVALQANSYVEILRALAFAREFSLDPVVTGALEADQVTPELKAHKARVIHSLNLPTRPRTLAPDADEPIETLRQRANAPKVPAALARAGVPFAFTSGGLREPRDFLRNAAKTVSAGLSADAALRALTLDAATLAGAADRLGSIERGKIANLIVTDGDLFDEKSTVKHVLVDGHVVVPDPTPAGGGRAGRGGNGRR